MVWWNQKIHGIANLPIKSATQSSKKRAEDGRPLDGPTTKADEADKAAIAIATDKKCWATMFLSFL
jgi:hypothetical protein